MRCRRRPRVDGRILLGERSRRTRRRASSAAAVLAAARRADLGLSRVGDPRRTVAADRRLSSAHRPRRLRGNPREVVVEEAVRGGRRRCGGRIRWSPGCRATRALSRRWGRRGQGRRRAPAGAGNGDAPRKQGLLHEPEGYPCPAMPNGLQEQLKATPGEARRLPLPRRGWRDPVHREGEVAALARAQLLPGGHQTHARRLRSSRSVSPISR